MLEVILYMYSKKGILSCFEHSITDVAKWFVKSPAFLRITKYINCIQSNNERAYSLSC